MAKLYAQTIFAVAHTHLHSYPFNNHGRTIRFLVQPNTKASALKIKFSNEYGEAPLRIGAVMLAKCDEDAEPYLETTVPVTVGGRATFIINPKETLWSDCFNFALGAEDNIALNIYYPDDEKVVSGNWVGTAIQRSAPGNFTVDCDIPGLTLASRLNRTFMHSDMTTAITSVCEIVAYRESPGKVFACFGDSITQQGNWAVPFAKMLYKKYPGEISLCNLGISGNRLLHNSPEHLGLLNGRAGFLRFEQNVMELHGLTHLLLELGSNDQIGRAHV